MTGRFQKAFIWSAVDQFGGQALQFGISVLLARLLAPAEFGLMGMVAVFLAIATCFGEAGLSGSLIQRGHITPDDETSVLCLNIVVGIILTLVLCAVSPLVADFYREARLKSLLCFCSLQLLVSSFGIVQFALLTREMDFRTQAILSTFAAALSGGIGIGMAIYGWGVWSLVGQSMSRTFFRVLLVWCIRPWRPKGRFRWACIRSLWPFSSRLLASGLLHTAFESLYALSIGRFFRVADLGFFTRASSLAQFPAGPVAGVTDRVTFPAFSRLQHDPAALRRILRKTIRIIATFHFPVMIGLAVVVESLISCLLGPKWLPCIPYAQIFCIAMLPLPLHVVHLNVLKANGRTDLFFRLEVIKKALTVIVIASTLPLGIVAICAGIALHGIICYLLNAVFTSRIIRYHCADQARDLLPPMTASLIAGAAAWGASEFGSFIGLRLLLLQVLTGASVYLVIMLVKRRTVYADTFGVLEQACQKVFALQPIKPVIRSSDVW